MKALSFWVVTIVCVAIFGGAAIAQQTQNNVPVGATQSAPAQNTAQVPLTAPASQQAPAGNKLLEGTVVEVELQDELKSGDQQVGTAVHFVVVKDVSNGQGVVIPAGSPAYGQVTVSKKSGFLGAPGKLNFTCDYVVLPNGTQIPLRGKELSNHGGDSRGASIATAVIFTPLTLFAKGGNAKAHKGQQFTMYVDHDVVLAPPPPVAAAAQPAVAKSLFVLASGGQVVGSLTSFDGQSYIVATDQGNMTFKATDVKAVYAITNNIAPSTAIAPVPPAPAPAAQTPPSPSPAPAVQTPPSPPPAPAAPAAQTPPPPPPPAIDPSVIGSTKHVIVATSDGNSYYGTVTKLDGAVYTIVTRQGTVQVNSSDIKSVQYPDK